MNAFALTPFLISAVLCATGGRLGRRLPPQAAAGLLTASALATALASGVVLSLAGVSALGQVPPIARLGHWSPGVLRNATALPVAVSALAGILAFALLVAGVYRGVRTAHAISVAASTCRQLGPGADGLVVIDDDEPTAYTVAGFTGRIVVSTAMLRALSAAERGAMLAHEAAHLRRRHHVYTQLTDIAAAANPLLRPLSGAVRLAVERWADEAAAEVTGDRELVARALARAGLARVAARPSYPDVVLAAAETHLAVRVRALLDPPPRHRALTSALVVALTAGTILTTATTTTAFHAHVETAQTVYIQQK